MKTADLHGPVPERGLSDLVGVLRRRWAVVLAGVLVCCLAAAAWSVVEDERYTASATIVLAGGSSGVGDDGSLGDRDLQADIGVLVSDDVQRTVARVLGIPAVPDVDVVSKPNSDVVEVHVTASDPDDAARVVNQYLTTFAEVRQDRLMSSLTSASAALQPLIDDLNRRLADLEDDDPLRMALADQLLALTDLRNELVVRLAASDGAVTIVRPATAPDRPDGVGAPVLVAIVLLAGLLIGVSVAFVLEFLDRRVRGVDDVARLLGPIVVSTVPSDRRLRKGPVLHSNFASASVESMRAVRVTLESPGHPRPLVVQFTGVSMGSGATTLSAHVAALLAGTEHRVVIVDAAAASPQLHDVFGTPPSPGVLGVLIGEVGGLHGAMRPALLSNETGDTVTVLPFGSSRREAADLLSGPSFASLVADLRARFDVVLVDTDPIRQSAASLAISMIVDEVCVVTRSRADTRSALELTVARLRSVGGRLGSVVINGVRH